MTSSRWARLVLLAALLALPGIGNSASGATTGPAVLAFGDAQAPGNPSDLRPNRPIVGMARTADGSGYWLVASDGGIFTFGTARFHGSMGGKPLNRPVVGMAATPDGNGYWLVASDGGIFTFGTARFLGSMGGTPLNQPIVGMAATSDGNGYRLVASDGGIFTFGTAGFHGSMGGKPLNRPVVGMAAHPTGTGYWMVASDGGIFAFNAPFHGSTGGQRLNRPIVSMTPAPTGYWLLASDGGVFSFDAPFHGSGVGKLGAGRTAAVIVNSPTGNGYNVLAVAAAVRIGFTGDVHGVGRVAAHMARGGDPLAGMRPYFAANEANIANLETAVGSSGSPASKQYTFQSPPELVYRLRSAGVNVVNLANNHSLDYGHGALLETINHSRNAGLQVVGAGANRAEAYRPAIVTTPGGTVAFLGFSQVVQAGWAATDSSPGVASAYDVNAAVNAVRNARAHADHVVVMVHAGVELADCPTAKQRDFSLRLIDAGADVVAGGHPHVLQGIERRGRGIIDYSLGNFVWYHNQSPSNRTALWSVELGTDGVVGHEITPALIDGNGSPQPVGGATADDIRRHVASLTPGAGRC
ncbi:MAG TPA: CapA family protein [Acidimicrobiales bacterium]|nr:CapA family protein [Acidimicrobiales bacterium]